MGGGGDGVAASASPFAGPFSTPRSPVQHGNERSWGLDAPLGCIPRPFGAALPLSSMGRGVGWGEMGTWRGSFFFFFFVGGGVFSFPPPPCRTRFSLAFRPVSSGLLPLRWLLRLPLPPWSDVSLTSFLLPIDISSSGRGGTTHFNGATSERVAPKRKKLSSSSSSSILFSLVHCALFLFLSSPSSSLFSSSFPDG